MDFDTSRTIVRGARGQWLALALLVALPALAAGQATTGTVRGTVRDPQGAVVPGAAVTVRNTDTNIARTATTGDHGEYLVTNLPTGNYEVVAELTGFTRIVRAGITLAVNQDAVVDVTRWRHHRDGLGHIRRLGAQYHDGRGRRPVRYRPRLGTTPCRPGSRSA